MSYCNHCGLTLGPSRSLPDLTGNLTRSLWIFSGKSQTAITIYCGLTCVDLILKRYPSRIPIILRFDFRPCQDRVHRRKKKDNRSCPYNVKLFYYTCDSNPCPPAGSMKSSSSSSSPSSRSSDVMNSRKNPTIRLLLSFRVYKV